MVLAQHCTDTDPRSSEIGDSSVGYGISYIMTYGNASASASSKYNTSILGMSPEPAYPDVQCNC